MKGLIIIITLLIITVGLVSCKSIKSKKQNNFRFRADDAFWLSDGRIVITGQVTSGEIKISEKLHVQIDSIDYETGIEKMEIFAKPNQLDIASTNDFVAFTVSGIPKEKIFKGLIFFKRAD